MKTFDHLFRAALLVMLATGLIIVAWHVSWLHQQDHRYQIQATDRNDVFILDRQQHIVYAGSGFFDDAKPVQWHGSPLPK